MQSFCNVCVTKRTDVLKYIKYIINVVLWTVVSLYLLTAVLLHIPYIQGAVASGVASVLSSTLDTRVEIGRVDLGSVFCVNVVANRRI